MKAINHFEQNRPVHLALRDIHYEHAIQLLKDPKHMASQALLVGDYEEILFVLRTARGHGRFAVRDNGKNEKDGQFCNFINMLAGNVKAVLSMLNLKHSVEANDSFFFSFLEVNHASVALQAEEYERRARDIICCMLNTLEIAGAAFEQLKQVNREAFNGFERERYDKSTAHYKAQIETHPDLLRYKKRTGLFA
ncbi:MAG: hypothetical protein KAU94_02190 [Verrucomicrobia bacterium]|nr:hypothetical protein [Verrucomicrobiota bacterium]